jgi:hypothetical protein
MLLEIEKIKKDKSKQVKLIYSLGLICVIILKTVAISLRKWQKYCWWEFGLITAQSFKHFSVFDNENFIIDVQNDACKSLKPLTKHYCNGFCDNIRKIEKAGLVMLIMGYLSVMMQLLCLGFHIWNYIFPTFRFRRIWVWIVFPQLVFLSGFLSWYLVIKPADIESFHSIHSDDHDRSEFELKEAFYLAMATIVIDMGVTLYGLFKTREKFLVEVGSE